MIVHIFNDQKKFSQGYFQMLKNNGFSLEEMELFHYGRCYPELELGERYFPMHSYLNFPGHITMYRHLKKADRIVVHSLASPFLLLMIWLDPSIAEKVYWVIWGKDLYFIRMMEHPTFVHQAYEWLRKRAIARIRHTVSILEEDYKRLMQWYRCDAVNIECNNLYPYCLNTAQGTYRETGETYTVLLGNSASRTNRHMQALDELAERKSQIRKIICPLSYGGSRRYAKRVAAYGKKLFGEAFVPLIDFMPKDQYYELLDSVDIGYFNYCRQEGLGNIWSLMFSKKTVYLNRNTSTWEYFERIGVQAKAIDEIDAGGLQTVSREEAENNAQVLAGYICEEASVKVWRTVLYGKN